MTPRPPRRLTLAGLGLVALAGLGLVVAACATGQADIEVGAARAGVPAGGATQVVVEIANTGGRDDRLVGASTPAATAVELHATEVADGLATMTELDAVTVPAGEAVAFRPGARHLMMVRPDETVTEGGTFPLTLHFDRSGEITVDVEVVPIADLIDGPVVE